MANEATWQLADGHMEIGIAFSIQRSVRLLESLADCRFFVVIQRAWPEQHPRLVAQRMGQASAPGPVPHLALHGAHRGLRGGLEVRLVGPMVAVVLPGHQSTKATPVKRTLQYAFSCRQNRLQQILERCFLVYIIGAKGFQGPVLPLPSPVHLQQQCQIPAPCNLGLCRRARKWAWRLWWWYLCSCWE